MVLMVPLVNVSLCNQCGSVTGFNPEAFSRAKVKLKIKNCFPSPTVAAVV